VEQHVAWDADVGFKDSHVCLRDIRSLIVEEGGKLWQRYSILLLNLSDSRAEAEWKIRGFKARVPGDALPDTLPK
jgi:hypothetical protein